MSDLPALKAFEQFLSNLQNSHVVEKILAKLKDSSASFTINLRFGEQRAAELAVSFIQSARSQAAQPRLSEAKDKVVVALRQGRVATNRFIETVLQSEACRLRSAEEVTAFSDLYLNLSSKFAAFAQELGNLPSPAVAALACILVRCLVAARSIGVTTIAEALRGRPQVLRLSLLLGALPSIFLAHRYRDTLLKGLHLQPTKTSSWQLSSQNILSFQQALQTMVRNSRQMPPIFWLSVAISGNLIVQVSENLTCVLIRSALRRSRRTIMFLAVIIASLWLRRTQVTRQTAIALQTKLQRFLKEAAALNADSTSLMTITGQDEARQSPMNKPAEPVFQG